MRALHILHRSIPGTHGYAIRSLEIVRHQRSKGIEPIVVTSPSQAPQGRLDADRKEIIDGVPYFRTGGRVLPPTLDVHDSSPVRSALRVMQNALLVKKVVGLCRTYRPDVIHAHSPFTCGVAAQVAGRRVGLPVVYEVRGIWEDSHVGRYGVSERSMRYRAVRRLESGAMRRADSLVVICEALKQEARSRGVNEENIFVVPNGVDVSEFAPAPPDPALLGELGLRDSLVTGYVGSFFHYEGLGLLIEAVNVLASRYPRLKLLMVGAGESAPTLKKRVQELGLGDRVVFTGRVPHDRAPEYYRLFDFMVLPRRLTRETRLVTPLKPMEIMAMEKPLIASDIGGHREIVENGLNGLLFESETASDLARVCAELIDDPERRTALGRRGREWVSERRNWDVLVDRYVGIYDYLTGRIDRAALTF